MLHHVGLISEQLKEVACTANIAGVTIQWITHRLLAAAPTTSDCNFTFPPRENEGLLFIDQVFLTCETLGEHFLQAFLLKVSAYYNNLTLPRFIKSPRSFFIQRHTTTNGL